MIRAIDSIAISKRRPRDGDNIAPVHSIIPTFWDWSLLCELHFGVLTVSSVIANFLFVISYFHGLLFNVTYYIISRFAREYWDVWFEYSPR
jgi:hypothetical protein